MEAISAKFTREQIAARAHQIWLQRNRPAGEASDHWALAIAELWNERLESARSTLPELPITPKRALDLGGTS
jgi:hypothetical protein